jgi:hypothetical protein
MACDQIPFGSIRCHFLWPNRTVCGLGIPGSYASFVVQKEMILQVRHRRDIELVLFFRVKEAEDTDQKNNYPLEIINDYHWMFWDNQWSANPSKLQLTYYKK